MLGRVRATDVMYARERAFSAHVGRGVPDASCTSMRLLSHALVKSVELGACMHFVQSSIITGSKHWVEIVNTTVLGVVF